MFGLRMEVCDVWLTYAIPGVRMRYLAYVCDGWLTRYKNIVAQSGPTFAQSASEGTSSTGIL